MFKRYALPLFTGPALLLGACGGTYNGTMDSVYQPVVQRQDMVLDLQTSGYGLAPGEHERLGGWLTSMRLGYGDRIAVDDGADGGAAREEVATAANEYGLMLSSRAPVTAGAVAPGTVRVVVTRMTANVPGCPDYSRTYQPDYQASTTSNFGCSINSNLAAMVANPVDLVRGQTAPELTDPVTSTKAIRSFRAAAPSGAGGTAVKSGGN